METTIARLFNKKDLGSKANAQKVEAGKWYKFEVLTPGQRMVGFGKVVRVIDEEHAEVERYFELPSYRPYAASKWYDSLPMAIA